ncbi:helix-turn-helix domain-containing protein [Desulforamulus aeronauticus]|uniref:Putative DNA-binding domain-containing protein n=1 Tax=Desulforamulus aeronauticus DSM 10349 TaxID=1121421 RepID=A0A1M6W0T3_9FIRM|nr:ATP-binding protein [Desulforamulus aeronauticus]SHK87381.1 Putative DNA-binding domain-containing protein [Desulforamulus aeronauticus DSM 10349]
MLNPFGKPLEQLEEVDLDRLIEEEISEGLYVEYKEDFPTHLAKIVTSFANTFGGWIVIGADARNPRNVPTSFPGIDTSHDPKDRFRNICQGNITPVPLFSSKLILKSDNKSRGILVVRIPESTYPPHLTKDGRIYRRNMEGSDPLAETDRHILDRLFEKTKLNKTEVKAFITRKLQKSDQSEVLFKVVCCPVPLNLKLIDPFFVPERISRLKKMARNIWKNTLPRNIRFEPEGFAFEGGDHRLEILRSGVITYVCPIPTAVKTIDREDEPHQLAFLDYLAVQVALLRTIKLTREVYRFTGYMGLFVPKVALENIQGKGLDDPKFFNFYKNFPQPQCKYADIILPYGFSPQEAKTMGNPRQVADPLLGYIYRCFGFEALDTHSLARS